MSKDERKHHDQNERPKESPNETPKPHHEEINESRDHFHKIDWQNKIEKGGDNRRPTMETPIPPPPKNEE